MIRLTAQKCIKNLLAAGSLALAIVRFEGNKHRVDLSNLLRIVYPQDPSPLRLVVRIEYPETLYARGLAQSLAPSFELVLGARKSLFVQIKGIEDQRFSFCVEHPAKRLSILPTAVG